MMKKGKHPGAVDNWLDTIGLYRKKVAYDETCLFRAISEQLFDCQVHHERVRIECITFARENYEQFTDTLFSKEAFLDHINKLEKHMVVCGDLELKIINKKYNRRIIIFIAEEQQIHYFTKEKLPDVFLLCLLEKDHYDVVFNKEHINSAGFCQSIVYKILYENVFEIPNVEEVVHNMLYDKSNIITQAQVIMEKKRLLNQSVNEEYCEEEFDEKFEEKTVPPVNIAPFPFKIAKALDPNIYRNIEYDSWEEMRREWRLGEWYYGDNKLLPGTKCILNDDNTNEKHDCYIQKILKDENKCIVYLTKLAEKRTVNYSDLAPEDDAKPWPLPYRFTKNVISPATAPAEKSPVKGRRRSKDKKRTKSESSILSPSIAIKNEPIVDNIDSYVGIPLQLQSHNSSENIAYCQTELQTETQTDSALVQDSIPTVLVENESVNGSRWYNNNYQWQVYTPQNMDSFVWSSNPCNNQTAFYYNLKPMVASAPVTPNVIPYHDPNNPNYYYNYHVDSYQTYPQWSSPSFELQQPPPPRNYQEKQDNATNNCEAAHQAESSKAVINNCENQNNGNVGSLEGLPPRFPQAPETPNYAQPCSPINMYSPVSPVMQVPQLPTQCAPVLYSSAPQEMSEVVMPVTPVIYNPYMSPPSPYVYPPTPPPTWYPGLSARGFVFPQRPYQP